MVNLLVTVYCKEIYFAIAVLSNLGSELGICGGNEYSTFLHEILYEGGIIGC